MRAVAALPILAIALATGCGTGRAPAEVMIVVDGEAHPLTAQVTCTRFPDGKVLIYASPSAKDHRRTVRIMVSTERRLVVDAAAFHLPDTSGYTRDSREMTAIRVDDTYTVSGRMPPEDGATAWRQFKINVTCPGYRLPSGQFDEGPAPGRS